MKKTNILYILADDMGYGDFGAFNKQITCTEALNRLVEEGMTLERCYSSSPVCAPARASIMTGRYPQRTGVIDTLEYRGTDRLMKDEVTIGDVFMENGYQTGLIGKWHLGCLDEAYHPNNRGFSYFYGFCGGWSDYYDYSLQCNGQPLPCDSTYMTDVFTQKAIEFIEDNKEEPFFLHLAYNAPHFPFQAPDDVVERYMATGKYTKAVSTIYAMIEVMDKGIGKILDTLDRLGIRDNTIIVFASDNGPELWGEGENNTERYNADFRGYKNLVWEGGIRVPAVVAWEGKIQKGTFNDTLVSHMDWLPTLMKMAGIDYSFDKKIDGRDVSKCFYGNRLSDRNLFWQWNRYYPIVEGNAAARIDGYKLINPPLMEHIKCLPLDSELDDDMKANPEKYPSVLDLETPVLDIPETIDTQLFHIDKDPGETKNLIDEHPDIADEMMKNLKKWFNEVEEERCRKLV